MTRSSGSFTAIIGEPGWLASQLFAASPETTNIRCGCQLLATSLRCEMKTRATRLAGSSFWEPESRLAIVVHLLVMHRCGRSVGPVCHSDQEHKNRRQPFRLRRLLRR